MAAEFLCCPSRARPGTATLARSVRKAAHQQKQQSMEAEKDDRRGIEISSPVF